jgi:hypothetical protein
MMDNGNFETPPRLRISPLSLTCPYCKAKRGVGCGEDTNVISTNHVERIEMAALADKVGALRTRAEKRARRMKENAAD